MWLICYCSPRQWRVELPPVRSESAQDYCDVGRSGSVHMLLVLCLCGATSISSCGKICHIFRSRESQVGNSGALGLERILAERRLMFVVGTSIQKQN